MIPGATDEHDARGRGRRARDARDPAVADPPRRPVRPHLLPAHARVHLHRARRGLRDDRHGRSRAVAAGSCRARRRGLPASRVHDRPALGPAAYRYLRRREPPDRRARQKRSPVPDGEVDRRLDVVLGAAASRSAGRLGRHARLGHARREVARRSPQLPEVHARQRQAGRPEALHHDGVVRAGGPRPVHLRRSRNSAPGRRPQPPGRRCEDPGVRRHRAVLERHGRDSAVPADARRHAGLVHHRRRRCAVQPPGSAVGRRENRSHRFRGTDALPRNDVERGVQRELSTDEGDFLREGALACCWRRALRRRLPSLQGRPRSARRFHKPRGARQRDAIPRAEGLVALGAGSLRGHARAVAILRRRDAVRICARAAWAGQASVGDVQHDLRGGGPVLAGQRHGVARHPRRRRAIGTDEARVAARPLRGSPRQRRPRRHAARRRRGAAAHDSAGARARRGDASAAVGSVQQRPAHPRRRARRRRAALHARPRVDHRRALDDGEPADVRVVRGTHGLWRALGDPVPRDERRLGGKRSGPRRHHDRLRVRHDGRGRRRQRRVRRRDATRLQAPAHRGALPGRPDARMGRHLGPRERRPRHRGQLRLADQRARHQRLGAHRNRRPLRARLPEKGRRRRDRRAHSRDALASHGLAPRVPARRVAARRHDVRRVPPLRQVRDARGIRPAADRPGIGVAGTVRDGHELASVRGGRGAPRRHRSHQGRRPHDGRRVRRLGRHVLVQLQRTPGAGRDAERAELSAGAAVGAARLHGRRKRRVRVAALRRAAERRRPLREGRRRRRRHGAARDAQQHAQHRARRRVAAPRRLGHRARRAHARSRRRADAARDRHVHRSVRPRVPAEPVAVHDRGGQRHAPHCR